MWRLFTTCVFEYLSWGMENWLNGFVGKTLIFSEAYIRRRRLYIIALHVIYTIRIISCTACTPCTHNIYYSCYLILYVFILCVCVCVCIGKTPLYASPCTTSEHIIRHNSEMKRKKNPPRIMAGAYDACCKDHCETYEFFFLDSITNNYYTLFSIASPGKPRAREKHKRLPAWLFFRDLSDGAVCTPL
jgi:hypothetical protein